MSSAKACARFDFGGRFGDDSFPSVSPAQQEKFRADFLEQLARVHKWLSPDDAPLLPPRINAGPYQPRSDFNIFVSEVYDKSKALVPAWLGQRGWIEFPAHRVVAGQASIAHEIVHVLYPNGNRMLAEGLAVYLQHKLFGDIPVYPNFGDHLESLVADYLFMEFPKRTAYALWNMDLEGLERISTPDELSLRIGRDPPIGGTPDNPDPPAEKFLYAVAGSFVEFLIENPGNIGHNVLTLDNFRAIYQSTPLRPLERDSGATDRWQKCYQGKSFKQLNLLWKTYMHFILCSKFATKFANLGDKEIKIPENYKVPLVEDAYEKLNRLVG
jgi:hypothetical protein